MNADPTAEPVCKFDQGCHRVVPCKPGCGAAAAVPVPPPADQTAPLPEVWVVWREDESPYGYFATEDAAKRATIDCWEEDEPVCPDYSWRRDGPRWELVVGGEHEGVYASRHRVYGAPEPAAAVAVLPEQTDRAAVEAERDELRAAWETLARCNAEDAAALIELGRLIGVAPPGRTVSVRTAVEAIGTELRRVAAEEQTCCSDPTCACDMVNAEGRCDCTKWGSVSTAQTQATFEATADSRTAPCAECGHPKAVHREGEDPVTPGECSACLDDDARHDHRPAVGEQPETQETP